MLLGFADPVTRLQTIDIEEFATSLPHLMKQYDDNTETLRYVATKYAITHDMPEMAQDIYSSMRVDKVQKRIVRFILRNKSCMTAIRIHNMRFDASSTGGSIHDDYSTVILSKNSPVYTTLQAHTRNFLKGTRPIICNCRLLLKNPSNFDNMSHSKIPSTHIRCSNCGSVRWKTDPGVYYEFITTCKYTWHNHQEGQKCALVVHHTQVTPQIHLAIYRIINNIGY
jgi:hypothetical protein